MSIKQSLPTYWKFLCTPAKIYFILAIITTIMWIFMGISIMTILLKLFFACIWTFVLGWLCKKGFNMLAWFLVLLPYIILALGIFEIFKLSDSQTQMLQNIQYQGVVGYKPNTN